MFGLISRLTYLPPFKAVLVAWCLLPGASFVTVVHPEQFLERNHVLVAIAARPWAVRGAELWATDNAGLR